MQRETVRRFGRPAPRGFTLLEMVLGLTILVLIFGVMFRLVEGSLVTMAATQGFGRKQQETTGLIAFFRAFCMDLPTNSLMGFKKNEGAIRFTNSQIALAPGPLPGRVLEFYRDKNNDRLMLKETVPDAMRPGARPKSVVEFCLATNVTEFAWSAYDPRKPEKPFAEWNDASRPAYLTLALRKDGQNLRADFWIPSGLFPGGALPSPGPAP